MSTVFLFPGQGSQQVGMLHDLPQLSIVRRTIEEAEYVLNEAAYNLDTKNALNATSGVQVALLISGVAMARALIHEGISPSFVAGHSVGAFGAAVISGSLDFKDALRLVKLRGELMEKSYPKGYGMGVVVGIQETKVVELINENFTEDAPIYIANVNATNQITVAGATVGIEKVLGAANKTGAYKAKLLNMSVPSHCILLDKVADKLSEALKDIKFESPIIPYAGIYKGRLLHDAQGIREDLALSVANPVRWHDVTSLLYELGARLFVEMPPGRVLTDLASTAFPKARAVAAYETDVDSLKILDIGENKV